MPRSTAVVSILLAAFPATSSAQDRDPPVALYRLANGERAAVLRSDLARELAARLRHTADGKEAAEGLIDLHVIGAAAKRLGIAPSAAEIGKKTQQIADDLAAKGDSLAAYLGRLSMDQKTFEERFVRAGVVQEQVVLRTLGSTDPNAVTPELIQLWLREARTTYAVETDPQKLPKDAIATVDGKPIDMVELGVTLFAVVDEPTREKHIRRFVLRDLIHREAVGLGIEVTADDIAEELARRRVRIESDPRFRGVPYDKWLEETQGMTIDEFRASPHLRATVEQRLISERLHPDKDLRESLARDRKAVLRRHGEKRALSAIMIRAMDTPNGLVSRTPAMAADDLRAVRKQCEEGRPFAELARVHSEDPGSKVKGGSIGEFPRETDELPESILAAAFELPLFGISEPLTIEGGMALVRVDTILPPPRDTELIARLRDELTEAWLAERLATAKIEPAR
ncbi:MAG: peptidylprolyl isomerase [Planctomycetota bacterium]